MPIRCYINSANPAQKYWTAINNDPNVPAGYVLSSGSDGAFDEKLQQYVAGRNNQGAGMAGPPWPNYIDGDPTQRTVQPNWPNGILAPTSGNQTTAQ